MTTAIVPSQDWTALQIGAAKLQVSSRTAKLLYVSREPEPQPRSGFGISLNVDIFDGEITVESLSPDEPSTIYTALPVRRPNDPSIVPRPAYFPSYAGLTPDQRWIYLSWLTNVTQPINIGYVFTYYYGLERHLLIGEFELAFDEILDLRRAHSHNQSFDAYSRGALLNSALFRKDRKRLEQIYRLAPPDRFSNADLQLAYGLGFDLGTKGLLRLAPALRGVNKRYLRSNPAEFESSLAALLSEEFGKPFLPFASRYAISDIPRAQHVLFANISFPAEVRSPALPDFISYVPFVEEASRVLKVAHERTKALLAQERIARRRHRSA